MPQTSVSYRQPAALCEGQIADTSIRRLEGAIQTVLNGVASNGILPFGRVIHRNAQGKAILPASAASNSTPILGVSLFMEKYGIGLSTLLANPDTIETSQAAIGFPAGAMVEYMQMGDVWMITEEAITATDVGMPVFYRYATGAGGTVMGRVRKAAVASEAEALPNAKFMNTASAGGLVIVRLGTFSNNTTAY